MQVEPFHRAPSGGAGNHRSRNRIWRMGMHWFRFGSARRRKAFGHAVMEGTMAPGVGATGTLRIHELLPWNFDPASS